MPTEIRLRPKPLANAKVLKLHSRQREVSINKARFKVVVAGRRWGKTFLSSLELFKAALKKRRALVWYVAPTYGMARDILWDQLIDMIPPQYIKRKHETKLTIRLINNSEIQLKGADKPDTLRGRGVDYVVLDEYQDFRPGTWEKVIMPTLADKRGHALIIGTPKAYNILYDVYIKGQKSDLPEWKSWQFPTSTSPFIPRSELEQAKRNLDEKSYRQEFEASFESMEGRVYHPFSREKHVGKFPFNPRLPIIVGQDFNVDPMCSAIMQYHDTTGELWIVDEVFLRQSNTNETVDELERRYWRHISAKRMAIYPDASGGNRSSARGETDLEIFRNRGIRKIFYHAKNPLVADRVNSVNAMLMNAQGVIRLRIDERCTETIKSLEQTIYKPNSREVDKKLGTEHMADAIGYPVHYLFPARKFEIMGASY